MVHLVLEVHSFSVTTFSCSLLNFLWQHEPVGLTGLACLYLVFVSVWCLFDVELGYLLKSLSAPNMGPHAVLFSVITCPDFLARFLDFCLSQLMLSHQRTCLDAVVQAIFQKQVIQHMEECCYRRIISRSMVGCSPKHILKHFTALSPQQFANKCNFYLLKTMSYILPIYSYT